MKTHASPLRPASCSIKPRHLRRAFLRRLLPLAFAAFLTGTAAAATLTVTNLNDAGAGSLRATIAAAAPGDTIVFQASLTGTIALTSGELTVSQALTINGPGATELIISGNSASRVFNITATGNLRLDRLTVANGRTTGGNPGAGLANAGTLQLTNCVIRDNNCANASGGGLFNAGTATLDTCIVSGNNAGGGGGGICARGSTASLTVLRSTLSGNSTGPSGGGGALRSDVSAFSTLTNCTVSGNSSIFGAGAYISGSSLTMSHSTVTNNSSPHATFSAGIFVNGAVLAFTNNLISGNLGGNPADVPAGSYSGSNNLVGSSTAGLGPLGFYGGFGQTHCIYEGSSAQSAGATGGQATDQRGAARVGGVEVGAFEINDGTVGGTYRAQLPGATLNAGYTTTIIPALGSATATLRPGSQAPPGLSLTTNAGVFSLTGTPSQAGVFDFSVRVSGPVSGSTNIDYRIVVLGPPASVAASGGSGQNATVVTAFGSPLTARVADAGGNPVPGVTVTFTAPASGPSASFAGGVNTAVTDSSGLATSPTLTANGLAGAYQVSAAAAGVSTPATFSLTNHPGAPASVTALSGGGQNATILAAYANPLAVTVRDAGGNAVPGVTVTFTAPSTGLSVTFAGGVDTAVTDSSGIATSAAMTARSNAGTFEVSASVAGVGTAASFSLTNTPGAPALLIAATGLSQHATILTAFADPLVARVTDAGGNAVPGITVTFTPPAAGASATFTGGVNTAVTDSLGRATSPTASANGTEGTYFVQASIAEIGGLASFRLTNDPGTPASVTAQSGGGQSATVLTAFANRLTARVTDAGGNPRSGITVTFAAPASGPSATFTGGVNTAVTDGSGVATSAALTANGEVGSFQVSASVAGVGTPATYSLTNTGTAPQFLSAAGTVFQSGAPGGFGVSASGAPKPTLDVSALPAGVAFDAPNGLLTWSPTPGTGGTYALTFTATNGVAPAAQQSFTLKINRPPTAGPATMGASLNTAVTLPAAKLVRVARDADGDALSVTAAGPTSLQGGTVVLAGASIIYTPPTGYAGPDAFSYTLSDGSGGSVEGSVTVSVAASQPSLNIASLQVDSAGVTIVCYGIPGLNYRIQSTDQLNQPFVDQSGVLTADATGRFVFLDPRLPGQQPPNRFYRAISLN